MTATRPANPLFQPTLLERYLRMVDRSPVLSSFLVDAKGIMPSCKGEAGIVNGLLFFLSAVLRGFSQLSFNSNPWSGICIIIGAGLGSWPVAVMGIIGNCFTTAFPLLFCSPSLRPIVCTGIFGLNGLLVGFAMACFDLRIATATTFSDQAMGVARAFLPLSIMSVTCAFFTAWIGKHWTGSTGIPIMTWPYNFTLLMWTASATLSVNFPTIFTANPVPAPQDGIITAAWFAEQWLRGTSQMMFSFNLYSGPCLLLGALIASPWSAFLTCWGSLVGLTVGVAIGIPFGSNLDTGLIGYNTVILATALGGYFLAPSFRGFIFMTFGCMVATIVTQACTNIVVSPNGGSFLALPFTITCTLLYGVMQSDVQAGLPLVPARIWAGTMDRHWVIKSRAAQAVKQLVDMVETAGGGSSEVSITSEESSKTNATTIASRSMDVVRRRSSMGLHMESGNGGGRSRSESEIMTLIVAGSEFSTLADDLDSHWRQALIESALRVCGSREAAVLNQRLPPQEMVEGVRGAAGRIRRS